jgi:hypothetical protein
MGPSVLDETFLFERYLDSGGGLKYFGLVQEEASITASTISLSEGRTAGTDRSSQIRDMSYFQI